ncbi:MAG: dihydropyrimidine dehydrogenase subunit B [Candidatus Sericytochromatia bacterium]|nr:MAG: dihydropyrimidine dehydrogenase subunit B [Candidatus Sericytochromatia bacterium]
MVDISSNFVGIKSPNPFWLASAPPTDKQYNVERGFEAGWGGAVWKTIGNPIVNVSSRYSSIDFGSKRMVGINNIELISDRPIEVNLKEIKSVKKHWPDRAVVASLMVESKKEAWHDIVKRTMDAGADGIELNFGCPHGMSERGMGSAVGQVPEYVCQIAEWVVEVSEIPVIVKLTPNISDITYPALAAKRAGAHAVSLINTINSITGVDLDSFVPRPIVGNASSHGGYCGPAVKPIALNMVASIASHPDMKDLPISGIGGISTWRDAVEFMLLGASNVQVCTAVMNYGFRIVEDMIDGLKNWMEQKGFKKLDDFIGLSVGKVKNWGDLDLNYKVVANINQDKCIKCGLCYIACEDASHQAISYFKDKYTKKYEIIEKECVGCNLCQMVCPIQDCITMEQRNIGAPYMNWAMYQEQNK